MARLVAWVAALPLLFPTKISGQVNCGDILIISDAKCWGPSKKNSVYKNVVIQSSHSPFAEPVLVIKLHVGVKAIANQRDKICSATNSWLSSTIWSQITQMCTYYKKTYFFHIFHIRHLQFTIEINMRIMGDKNILTLSYCICIFRNSNKLTLVKC